MSKKLVMIIGLVFVVALLAGCCEHEWEEATCTEPETCALCGKTQGEPLGHDEYDWTDWEINAVECVYEKTKWCKRCETISDRQVGDEVTSFIDNGMFIISANAFESRFDSIEAHGSYYESDLDYDGTMYSKSNTLKNKIMRNDTLVGMYSFEQKDGTPLPFIYSGEENSFDKVLVLIGEKHFLDDIVFVSVSTVDPSLDEDTVDEITDQIIDNMGKDSGIVKNGIRYALVEDSPYLLLGITCE